MPIGAFGLEPPADFFNILGRILAVNSQIEYIQGRLGHIPASETADVRKVEQFLSRCDSGRDHRNALVHSRWLFGAVSADPNVILGLRYKNRKRASTEIAVLTLSDVPNSEREHETVQHTMSSMKALLKRDVVTMRIGTSALSEIQLNWSKKAHLHLDAELTPKSDGYGKTGFSRDVGY